MKLTLDQAIEKTMTTDIVKAMKAGRLSKPEILKIAALRCFVRTQEDGAEEVIREAMQYMDLTGLYPNHL